MPLRCFVACCLLGVTANLVSAEELHVAEFQEGARPKNWSVNFGHWEPENGVLVCRQLDADNHPAASRWQIPLTDGVITCRLKFVGAKGFHIGFDPVTGQLEQHKGHLYSLVVSPGQVSLKKHRNKADELSKDATLGTASFNAGSEWIHIEVRASGNEVVAILKQGTQTAELRASHPSFHVAKPAVVFRTMGGDAHLDDVTVQVTKPGLPVRSVKKPDVKQPE